jgi:hypothetical protein
MCWPIRSVATTHEAKCMTSDLNIYCFCWTEVCAACTVPRGRRDRDNNWQIAGGVTVTFHCFETRHFQRYVRDLKILILAPLSHSWKFVSVLLVPSSTAVFLGLEENLEVPLSIDFFNHQFCDASVDRFEGSNCCQQEFVPSGWWV